MKLWAVKIQNVIFCLLLFMVSSNCNIAHNGVKISPYVAPSEIMGSTPYVAPTETIGSTPSPTSTLPPQVAFPGAEGFGKESVGGRGGIVLEVTNLDNDGPGSFRTAVDADGPRIVIFRIAGTIELKTPIEIKKPYITIAGQSAPGGGITLKNDPSNADSALIIATHDVIIRYIRSRPGPPQSTSSNGDALEILGPGAYNIIIDHCSFSWAIDEVASTWYDSHDITIQWSIISEGLNCSKHVKGCHSMGLLLGSEGSGAISVHHNLFVHNGQRNPLIQTSGVVDVVNNVIFDTVLTPITINDGYGVVSVNIIGNYYKQTPGNNEYFISASSESGVGIKIFVKGNITPSRPNDGLNEGLVVKPDKGQQWLVSSWIDVPVVTTTTAFEAYDQVLAEAGATIGIDSLGARFARRDAVDERIVNDVKKGIARIVDDPSQVGGWPILASGTAPRDTDKDGMPDDWEVRYGLNPSDPVDGAWDVDGDGYTNIEEYLNGTDPNSPNS
jgi:pectate lyase